MSPRKRSAVKAPWNKWRRPAAREAAVYAAKGLDCVERPTLPAPGQARVYRLAGCPTASTGFGAEPQRIDSEQIRENMTVNNYYSRVFTHSRANYE